MILDDYMEWTPVEYREQLNTNPLVQQFKNDIDALVLCDACEHGKKRR